MKPSNLPAKHHYIPRFLLAPWAVNDGKLWRFVRPVSGKVVTKLVAPAEVGYERDLYATPGLPAANRQQVEQHFMSPLDSQAAEVHRTLLSGEIEGMPQRQRSAWSRFIMSQWFRTPTGLEYFKQAVALVLRVRDDALDERYQELRKEGYPESLEELIELMGPGFTESATMDLLRRMSDDPTNGLRLNNMHWSVVDTIGGDEFLISDVALQQSRAGIFSPHGYMTMPIAPNQLFVAVNTPDVAAAIRKLPRADLVSRNNSAVVRRASLFVGATDLSQETFVGKNFGTEEHATFIKGLADGYRADAEAASGEPL